MQVTSICKIVKISENGWFFWLGGRLSPGRSWKWSIVSETQYLAGANHSHQCLRTPSNSFCRAIIVTDPLSRHNVALTRKNFVATDDDQLNMNNSRSIFFWFLRLQVFPAFLFSVSHEKPHFISCNTANFGCPGSIYIWNDFIRIYPQAVFSSLTSSSYLNWATKTQW